MQAANKLPDWDRALSQSDTATSSAAHLIQQVMKKVASATNHGALEQLLRFHGPELVRAFTELAQSGQAEADSETRSLEDKLSERGVRQSILDNLEIARLHFRRGMMLADYIRSTHRGDELPENVGTRLTECTKAAWEHFFGLTFLSLVASGFISENEPGVEAMLPWMRTRSREVYVHATAADDALRNAA